MAVAPNELGPFVSIFHFICISSTHKKTNNKMPCHIHFTYYTHTHTSENLMNISIHIINFYRFCLFYTLWQLEFCVSVFSFAGCCVLLQYAKPILLCPQNIIGLFYGAQAHIRRRFTVCVFMISTFFISG